MICAGCGLELSPSTGRGRPARFHNGACRLRAHRARQASRHTEVLAHLGEIEAAVSELRRAVLTGQPPERAHARLVQATSELARRLGGQPQAATQRDERPQTAGSPAGGSTTPREPEAVTENVTIQSSIVPAPEPAVRSDSAADPDRPPPHTAPPTPGTENVTKQGTSGTRAATGRRSPSGARRGSTPSGTRDGERDGGGSVLTRRRVARPEPLDLDTVRLERIVAEAGESAGWRVLAGDTETPTQVGTVKRGRRGRWEALNASLVEVPGGPWRTRQDAVVHLVDQHQRRAGAGRSR